jgi:hypothetical protein
LKQAGFFFAHHPRLHFCIPNADLPEIDNANCSYNPAIERKVMEFVALQKLHQIGKTGIAHHK